MLFAVLAAASVASIVVQKCLPPPFGPGVLDWALIPLVVIYGALVLPAPAAWVLALLAGLCTDLLALNRLGTHSAILLLIVFLLQTQDLARNRSRWYFQLYVALVGSMAYIVLDYLAFCVQENHWLFSEGLLHRAVWTALFNAGAAPVIFGIVNLVLTLAGYRFPAERPSHAH